MLQIRGAEASAHDHASVIWAGCRGGPGPNELSQSRWKPCQLHIQDATELVTLTPTRQARSDEARSMTATR